MDETEDGGDGGRAAVLCLLVLDLNTRSSGIENDIGF